MPWYPLILALVLSSAFGQELAVPRRAHAGRHLSMFDPHGFEWLGGRNGDCDGTDESCAAWVRAAENQATWLRRIQADKCEPEMCAYLRGLYGEIAGLRVERLNFFWNSAPRRETFAATWKCVKW